MIVGFLILMGWMLVAPPPAHAYLDPGSGSMMVQLVLAGVAGVVIAIKVFWRRVVSFFTKKSDRD